MDTFYDQIMGLPKSERLSIAESAGMSLQYVMKHTYVRNRTPKFHFHNAVAMDQSSNGVLPFIQHTEGEIDWEYVRRSLNRAHRRGEL